MAHPRRPELNNRSQAPPRLVAVGHSNPDAVVAFGKRKGRELQPASRNNAGHNAVYTVTDTYRHKPDAAPDSLGGRGENSAFLREDFR